MGVKAPGFAQDRSKRPQTARGVTPAIRTALNAKGANVTDDERDDYYDNLMGKFANDGELYALSHGTMLALLNDLKWANFRPPVWTYCMKGEVRAEWYRGMNVFILTWAHGGTAAAQWYYYTERAGTRVESLSVCLEALRDFLK
jgi:hypothetical protein